MPKFDLHVQALPVQEQRDTFKFMSFGFSPSIGIKGFQMLLNQWVMCLLTPRNSDPTDLSRGTDFTKLIGSNLPLADARDVSAIAIEECNEQIFKLQRSDGTLTASERLASAEIIDFQTDPTAPGFSVYVEIKNQARERLVLNLPATALTE